MQEDINTDDWLTCVAEINSSFDGFSLNTSRSLSPLKQITDNAQTA